MKEETNLEVEFFHFNESKFFEKSNSLINNFIVQTKDENFELSKEVDYGKWYEIEEAKREILPNSLAEYFLNQAIKKLPSIIKMK